MVNKDRGVTVSLFGQDTFQLCNQPFRRGLHLIDGNALSGPRCCAQAWCRAGLGTPGAARLFPVLTGGAKGSRALSEARR